MGNQFIKIEGVKSIQRKLESLPEKLQKSAEQAVLRAGSKAILNAAKSHVQVDTGNLKKSLGVKVSMKRGAKFIGAGRAYIGPRTGFAHPSGRKSGRKGRTEKVINADEYSWYLESGTPHMAARPFIRPAIDSSKGEILNAMAAGLDKHLTRVAARLAAKK